MTLAYIKKAYYLRLDICSRVFRSLNLLEELQTNRTKDFDGTLIGRSVITNYGKRRTFRIVSVRRDLTPLS